MGGLGEFVNASTDAALPPPARFADWVAAALAARPAARVDLRVVDMDEGRDLNRRFRGQDKATNVLAFPCSMPEPAAAPLLGDLVLCAPVVRHEAGQQAKDPEAHWAHLVVHGCLHLLGYDHQQDREAARMEARETELLLQLGYPAPYAADGALP